MVRAWTRTARRAKTPDSQLASHDHLGLVRIDRAALLEQVDRRFVAIYKQQALAEDVQVDELACKREY